MAYWDGAFSGRPFTLRLHVNNKPPQNIANNESTVDYALDIRRNGNWTTYSATPGPFNIYIGPHHISGSFTYDFRNQPTYIRIASGSRTVKHGPNGALKLHCSANASGTGLIGSASLSGSMNLPTIPRAGAQYREGSSWDSQLVEAWDGSKWALQAVEHFDGTNWVRQN